MQASQTPKKDGTQVALVLDAGGARSAYQVGALEVLIPALAEHGARPRVLVGTSAGALLTAALSRGEFHWAFAVQDRGLSTAAVYAAFDDLRAGTVVPDPEESRP